MSHNIALVMISFSSRAESVLHIHAGAVESGFSSGGRRVAVVPLEGCRGKLGAEWLTSSGHASLRKRFITFRQNTIKC